jgi:hypothetical protein
MSDELVNVVDALDREISEARTIAAAIIGLNHRRMPDPEHAREGLLNFQLTHIQRLVTIHGRLDALRQPAP